MTHLLQISAAMIGVLFTLLAANAWAVDGVVLIDQNKALAGNVTPGDAPGFPVIISQPGSYRLSSNLTVPDENTTGVEIRASAVTLDLNGFAILGPGRPGTRTHRGIEAAIPVFGGFNFVANVTITNGTVGGMGGEGLFVVARGATVSKIRSHNNAGRGIYATGFSMMVLNNIAGDNAEGIYVDGSNSVVRGNAAFGIGLGGRITVTRCPTSIVANAGSEIVVLDPGCTRDQNAPSP